MWGFWVAARRFGVTQKIKLRVNDDYSVLSHSDATFIPETVSLGGSDAVVSLVRLLMQSSEYQVFSVTLAGGTIPTGAVHGNWPRDGRAPVDRTLDLTSACRQWALPPAAALLRGDMRVQPPFAKTPELFHQTALLLGARSSVHHLHWVARMILQVFVSSLRVLSTTFFDDVPTLGTDTERVQLTSCVEALFRVTGWSPNDTDSCAPSLSARCPN